MADIQNFSAILPTYRRDTPSELAQAIDSLAEQTIPPNELFIVKDGPLTEQLDSIIDEKREEFPASVQTHQIDKNKGLGNALRIAIKNCSYDLVARMDADDISVPDRFEMQLKFLSENPNVDIVGGQIEEFAENPTESIAKRGVPTNHAKIEKMAKFRSPMNHGTVIYHKDAVLEAGNYRTVDRMEDYDLWVRMLLNDATFANIPEVLVKVRAGAEIYERRGGWEYTREEVRTQVESYKRNFIPFPIFIFNILSRTTLRLLPNRIRKIAYQTIARD